MHTPKGKNDEKPREGGGEAGDGARRAKRGEGGNTPDTLFHHVDYQQRHDHLTPFTLCMHTLYKRRAAHWSTACDQLHAHACIALIGFDTLRYTTQHEHARTFDT
ncbi:unnamed protein product, partial [Ectocarpus sp. 12 AP-2014]